MMLASRFNTMAGQLPGWRRKTGSWWTMDSLTRELRGIFMELNSIRRYRLSTYRCAWFAWDVVLDTWLKSTWMSTSKLLKSRNTIAISAPVPGPEIKGIRTESLKFHTSRYLMYEILTWDILVYLVYFVYFVYLVYFVDLVCIVVMVFQN